MMPLFDYARHADHYDAARAIDEYLSFLEYIFIDFDASRRARQRFLDIIMPRSRHFSMAPAHFTLAFTFCNIASPPRAAAMLHLFTDGVITALRRRRHYISLSKHDAAYYYYFRWPSLSPPGFAFMLRRR